MVYVKTTYTVWTWDNQKMFRVGRAFKTKQTAEKYSASVPLPLHIGTTVNMKIIDTDVA
jgi:hypothetical protein